MTDQIPELEALIQSGNFSEALNRIEAIPQTERSRWQILNLTGIICLYCGQPEQAETFFGDALRQEPDNPEILYNLAECCVCLEKYRKAEELLCRCEQVSNEDAIKEDIAALRERISSAQGGRVLMAAYYFPPLSGSGVFRSLKFAKYLPLFGWQPTVISTDRPPNGWNFADDSLTAEIPSDVEVIRIPDLINTNRADSLSMERIQAVLQFLYDILRNSPEANQIFSQTMQYQEGIVRLFRFPCKVLSWAYDVVQYIEKNVDMDKFRVIYTTSGPFSTHLIGFYMKQKYGIPWVADYRDPWTFNAYNADYDAANPKQKLLFELESILLHQADCNLTVEDGLIESYRKHFNLPKERIVSVTNGYDEEDFSALAVPEKQTEKFTINYSGLIYTNTQSFAPVCSALKQLSDEKKIDLSEVNLCFVGATNKDNQAVMKEFGLENIFTQMGYVSHRETLQSNLDANLLLLLVGDEEKFKPIYTGKVFDYLRSGRPILALAPKDGVVDQILRESGHGQAFLSTQTDGIKEMIWREYQKWKAGDRFEPRHSPAIKKFERKVLTKRLARILDKAASSSADTMRKNAPLQPPHSTLDERKLDELSALFLTKNYNYVWLKAMLQKGISFTGKDAAIITGSSYGVNGIIEHQWNYAVNCSVSSQDLYYDFLCARCILANKGRNFSKCFILGSYYSACHDLSRGARERALMISNVYYPIFKDAHNWESPYMNDLWAGFGSLSDEEKARCETMAIGKMLDQGTFFSSSKKRGGTVFDLNGRQWWEVPPEERMALGKIRAEAHNKLFQDKTGISENKKILKEYVHFLHINDILPIFVIPPFTKEYNRYISGEMKKSVLDLLDSVSEEIRFIDFNRFSGFDAADFVDTDHLSETGAEKFSRLLVEKFGR